MLKSKLITAIATSSLLLGSVAPMAVLADTQVDNSGNGAFSNSGVTVNNTTTQTVTQGSTANVSNNIDSSSSTGGNNANYNTGGTVTVQSGSASSTTAVTNNLNSNAASLGCGCDSGTLKVTDDGNGAFSTSGVTANNTNTTTLTQTNLANVHNNIDSDAKTGGNNASYNTGGLGGGGAVNVMSGPATSVVGVSTTANSNVASIGNGAGAGAGMTVLDDSGNGAFSHSGITLNDTNSVTLTQGNTANVYNHVDSDALSGGNSANYTTGGSVNVTSGAATSKAYVDNNVNFNWAALDCGCALGGNNVKFVDDGNGAFSTSGGTINNTNTLGAAQTELANLHNNVDSNASTGWNGSSYDTAGVLHMDPSVMSGPATEVTSVSNSGNSNVLSNGTMSLPGGNSIQFSNDFSGLMAFWGMLFGMHS